MSETHVGLPVPLGEQGAQAQQGSCLHGAVVLPVQLALVLQLWQHELALWLRLAQGLQTCLLLQEQLGCVQEPRLGCLGLLWNWLLTLLR